MPVLQEGHRGGCGKSDETVVDLVCERAPGAMSLRVSVVEARD